MKPAATLGVYAGALALVFGAAVGVGNAVGPVGTAADDASHSADSGAQDAHGSAGADHGGDPAVAVEQGLPARGLAISQDGYTLQLERTVLPVGRAAEIAFTVTDQDGDALTGYTPEHDKDLHLIVVRRDLTGFQHVHPTRDAQGRWAVPLTLDAPGPYKVYADFTPAGRDTPLTLAADLTAPGAYTPAPLPAATGTSSVDGYDVRLHGALVAGTSSELTLSVSKDGRPVTDLQPYLAAYGHLVALRDGDLAYLHVHPDGEVDDPGTEAGPDITFYADVPTAATYRLFLDFQHAGTVRTASFTAEAAR
ncbi:MAG: hypothetical protein JWN08_615 [Frankiales bacterium]|nr:hypothetical protein [Frankiales bacterium]